MCALVPTLADASYMRCSNRWENPLCPGFPLRYPVLYVTETAKTGAVWSGAMITRKPLSRVVSVSCSLGNLDCARHCTAIAVRNAQSRTFMNRLLKEAPQPVGLVKDVLLLMTNWDPTKGRSKRTRKVSVRASAIRDVPRPEAGHAHSPILPTLRTNGCGKPAPVLSGRPMAA